MSIDRPADPAKLRELAKAFARRMSLNPTELFAVLDGVYPSLESAAATLEAQSRELAELKREVDVAYERGLRVAITELVRHADGHGAMRSGHSERVTLSLAELLESYISGRYRTEAEVFAAGESAGREATQAQLAAAEAARDRLQAEVYARNGELRAAWNERDALARRLEEAEGILRHYADGPHFDPDIGLPARQYLIQWSPP